MNKGKVIILKSIIKLIKGCHHEKNRIPFYPSRNAVIFL